MVLVRAAALDDWQAESDQHARAGGSPECTPCSLAS
jgi:hypothetical protein